MRNTPEADSLVRIADALTTPQQIVSAIESEPRLVAAKRELIVRFELKNGTTLARIWAEDETP